MSYFDSTVAEYNTQINNHNQTISECNTAIKQFEDDIEDLKRFRMKINSLDGAVDIAVSATSNKINKLPSVITNAFAFLKLNYFSNFLDVVMGVEHTRAKDGLDRVITKINNKIKELQNKIENLHSTITQCQNSISSLNHQKYRYIKTKEEQQKLIQKQREMEERIRQGANQQG